MNLDYLLQISYSLWDNVWIRTIIIYLWYVLFLFFILMPIAKKLFVPLVNKTKTNLDNEIYWKIKTPLKVLLALLGLNIVYNFFGLNFPSYCEIIYKVLLTVEFIILYVILHRVLKVLAKYWIKKFSGLITKNVANFIKLVIDIFVFSVITLLVLKAWWVNITPLLASAGIFGLAVAMASKSIIENFLSGLILFADKTINVGDTIVLSDGTTAVVEEINIRTTRLRTFDGNVVIIPNSELLNEKIINKSLSEVSPQKRVEVTVWISYGDDTQKAKELLKQYLLELEGADSTTVVVFVDALADWSVNITGRIMVDADKRSYLLEKQILEKVYNEFPEKGLNFPFPTYDINLHSK